MPTDEGDRRERPHVKARKYIPKVKALTPNPREQILVFKHINNIFKNDWFMTKEFMANETFYTYLYLFDRGYQPEDGLSYGTHFPAFGVPDRDWFFSSNPKIVTYSDGLYHLFIPELDREGEKKHHASLFFPSESLEEDEEKFILDRQFDLQDIIQSN